MKSDPGISQPPVPDSRHRRFCLYWLPLILACAAIFFQSAFPSVRTEPLFPHDDKLLHMAAYGLLAVLFARALNREKPEVSPKLLYWSAVGFAACYGLTDELHQAFVPSRQADLLDLLADIAGAMIGAKVYLDFLPSGT